jgi:hypothetical protein
MEQTYNSVCNYIGCIRFGNVSSEDIQAMINDLPTQGHTQPRGNLKSLSRGYSNMKVKV